VVNHKQTLRQEFFGKYIWSPNGKKRQINPFLRNMREVAPGDIIYFLRRRKIQASCARTHVTHRRVRSIWQAGMVWMKSVACGREFQKFTEPILPAQPHAGTHADVAREIFSDSGERLRQPRRFLAQIPRAMALVVRATRLAELLGIIQGIQFSETAATPLPELARHRGMEEHECTLIFENHNCAKRKNRRSSKRVASGSISRESRTPRTILPRYTVDRPNIDCKPHQNRGANPTIANDLFEATACCSRRH